MRRLVPALALALLLLAPAAASAHPLGNFTVNQYSRIQASGDRMYVKYVLDLAEIPTFQARTEVDEQGEAAYGADLAEEIRRHLRLAVDGEELQLRELGHLLAFLPGAGGLETTRLEIVLATGELRPHDTPLRLAYRDENFASRIGWKEIVLVPEAGSEVVSSSVPEESVSDELRTYPQDLLQSPLDVREASAEIRPGAAAGPPPTLGGRELEAPVRSRSTRDGGFAALVDDDLSAGVILASIFVAMFWGAAHALGPGHGKAIVAAYLVGTRGTARHALLLGGIVTVTHTIGVFALGLVTLALSALVVPDRLYPWLNLVAAILVVVVGLSVLRLRLRDWRRGRRGAPHGHSHHRPDDAHHERHHPKSEHAHHEHHHHRHAPEPALGWRGLLGVGISGGLLPCPSALVVLLAAISLHRVGYGLVLILAFSVGLAATISGIGLLVVGAKRVFGRVSLQGRAVRVLPALSALVILAFGIAMTVRAVPALA